MNNMRNKILMTLALLLTAVTGAWAQTPSVKLFTVPDEWANDETSLTAADLPADFVAYSSLTDEEAKAIPNPDPNSQYVYLIYMFNEGKTKMVCYESGSVSTLEMDLSRGIIKNSSSMIIFYYTTASDEVKVTPVTGKTNEWTFTMPAFDVEIAPIYAPTAQWAKVENVDQLPTAIEGIYAESTDAIVKAGTVAKIGDTENPQGTVMYAVTSTNQATAPALTAFSADVPTAKDIAIGSEVLVWYYIKGADTPEGETATAENTFNDSEICATPLTVTVLSNKFDIQFKAANANTIEAGKATVKVGETAAEVKEGKLTGVKMGSKVTITAKDGYKFRKVEVKKKGAPKYADVVTMCEKNGDNKYLLSSFFDGTNANITTITKEEAIALAEYLGGGNIYVVYEDYEFYGDRYGMATNAAGNETGILLSTTNTFNVPLYYVPAGN